MAQIPQPNTPKRCVTHHSDERNVSEAETVSDEIEVMMSLAAAEPILVARRAQLRMTALNTGFAQGRAEMIGAAYACAFHMTRDHRAWVEFLKADEWKNFTHPPKSPMKNKNRMLSHVMRFIFSAEGRQARNRANVYAGALQYHFDKGTKPPEALDLIRRRGIETLRREAVARRQRGRPHSYLDDMPSGGKRRRKRPPQTSIQAPNRITKGIRILNDVRVAIELTLPQCPPSIFENIAVSFVEEMARR